MLVSAQTNGSTSQLRIDVDATGSVRARLMDNLDMKFALPLELAPIGTQVYFVVRALSFSLSRYTE